MIVLRMSMTKSKYIIYISLNGENLNVMPALSVSFHFYNICQTWVMKFMNIRLISLVALLVIIFPTTLFAVEVTGAGSMIPVPLMKAWSESYSARTPGFLLKYQGSNPADGIKRLVSNEVDFSGIDMPLNIAFLQKNG
jgi:ABC-type phosphate transport system substrate-binding protein